MSDGLKGTILYTHDMEVYKYDWVAGFKNVNTQEYIQIHNDRDALKAFLDENRDAMFFTINGERYDNNIVDAILKGKDPYDVSQLIIRHNVDLRAWRLPVVMYDLSKQKTFYPSLKAFESNNGMSIEELPITATYDQKLTEEQLEILKAYNRHDLDATEVSLLQRMPESIMVKARLIKYFGLDFRRWITRTIVSIVAKGLGAKKGKFPHQAFSFDGIYSTLDIANERVREHLMTERFYDEDLIIEIAGLVHHIKKGGIHAASHDFVESNDCWHVDFASFYPSIMIEYDLLSRALPGEEGLAKFKKVRADRYVAKAAKSLDDIALKECINSVFGAANSEYSDLYDPSRSQLVCMYGQAFAIDLTEKLEPYVNMLQSNTDGIIFELKEKTPECEASMRQVIADFTERTRLKMDIEHYSRFAQKDVNNYVAILEGKPQAKGSFVNMWNLHPRQAHYRGTYRLFQQTVVDRAVAFNLLYGKKPEETVQEEYDARNWYRFMGTSKAGKMYHKIAIVEEHDSYLEAIEEMNKKIKDKDIKKMLRGTRSKKNPDPGFGIKINNYFEFLAKYENDEFDEIQLEVLELLDIRPIINKGKVYEVQHTNRVFASKSPGKKTTLYKYKWADVKNDGVKTGEKKISQSVITGLPRNVFVFNDDMDNFTEDHWAQVDIDYYVDKAYEKIAFFHDTDIKKNDKLFNKLLEVGGQDLRDYVSMLGYDKILGQVD